MIKILQMMSASYINVNNYTFQQFLIGLLSRQLPNK